MTTTAKPVAPKQLKKNDFIAVIGDQPMTRGQIIDELAEFEFLGSWLEYLIDHFTAQGKIQKNEDGTIQKSTKKGGGGNTGGVRTAFRVEPVIGEDGDETDAVHVVSKKLAPGEAIDKDNGWAGSHNRAVKNAVSEAHKVYTSVTTQLKTLLIKDEAETAK